MTAPIGYSLVTVLLAAAVLVGAEEQPAFYAFDNGLTRIPSLEEKAAVLKELGYDGVGSRPGKTAEWLEVLEPLGLRIGTLYVVHKVSANQPAADAGFARELELLKGKGTIIWYGLARNKGATDEIAVRQLRKVGDKAAAAGLPVVIYPHVGFYAESMEQIVRLVRKANHPNVGASFNLCHFLKLDNEKNLEGVLKEAAPHLRLVQLSGADSGDTRKMAWNRLIQPLGKGTFDMDRLLRILDNTGYRGPFCLQCYKIPGDDRENLKQSMEAWKALNR
jgi:sugar phosphate isomerase/epimerase